MLPKSLKVELKELKEAELKKREEAKDQPSNKPSEGKGRKQKKVKNNE